MSLQGERSEAKRGSLGPGVNPNLKKTAAKKVAWKEAVIWAGKKLPEKYSIERGPKKRRHSFGGEAKKKKR